MEPALVARFEGTRQVEGNVAEETRGSYRAHEEDFETEITVSSAEGSVRYEHRFVNGACYWREEGGPWSESPPDRVAGSLPAVLALATWQVSAARPSELTSPDLDLLALAAALGLLGEVLAPDQTDAVTGDVVLEVGPTGSLVSIALDLQHEVSVYGGAVSTDIVLTYTFDQDPEVASIEKPDDVWEMHWSAANGYAWNLPSDWQFSAATSQQPWDTFRTRDRDRLMVQLFSIPADTPADEALDVFAAELLAEDQTLADSGLRLQLDGVSARYLTGTFTAGYNEVFHQLMVLATGGYLYQLQMMTLAGEEDADSDLFFELLGGFTPLINN